MADYRFLGADLRTGAILGELPLSGVRYGRVLNGAGRASGSMSLAHRTTTGTRLSPAYLAATAPGRTGLWVERDGVLMWGGVIWARDYNDGRLTIEAAELWSYFHRRRLGTTKTYSATDQLDIVRDLIDYAQSQPGGDIRIDVVTTDSGVVRDRTYYGYERQVIGTLVEQLAAVNDGFDFSIDVAWTPGGELGATLNFGYPQRGRRATVTGIVFEPGRNIGSYRWPEDASRQANVIVGVGAGEGDAMLGVTVEAGSVLDIGYPRLTDVISHKDVRVLSTLTGHANAALSARRFPIVNPTMIDVQVDSDPPLGSWIMGDECRFRVDVDDERFPDGLDRRLRIVADEVTVADEGVETVTITCGEVQSA